MRADERGYAFGRPKLHSGSSGGSRTKARYRIRRLKRYHLGFELDDWNASLENDAGK